MYLGSHVHGNGSIKASITHETAVPFVRWVAALGETEDPYCVLELAPSAACVGQSKSQRLTSGVPSMLTCRAAAISIGARDLRIRRKFFATASASTPNFHGSRESEGALWIRVTVPSEQYCNQRA